MMAVAGLRVGSPIITGLPAPSPSALAAKDAIHTALHRRTGLVLGTP